LWVQLFRNSTRIGVSSPSDWQSVSGSFSVQVRMWGRQVSLTALVSEVRSPELVLCEFPIRERNGRGLFSGSPSKELEPGSYLVQLKAEAGRHHAFGVRVVRRGAD